MEADAHRDDSQRQQRRRRPHPGLEPGAEPSPALDERPSPVTAIGLATTTSGLLLASA